jgi:small-conductance mechanosensitive channel
MSHRNLILNAKLLGKLLVLGTILYYLGSRLNLFKYLLNLEGYYDKILVLVVLFIGTLIFLDISLELIRRFFEKKGEIRDYPVVESVFRYITWFIAIIIALSFLYQGIGSLVMSLGLIGAGITLALQRPIMNFAGWINLVVTRPFKINDRIYIKDIGVGDVYKIDTMHIYLREINGESTGRNLIIPNAYILTNAIVNYTKGSQYVWDSVEVSITYESDWKKAKKLVFEAANEVVGENMRKLAEIWKTRPRQFAKTKIQHAPIIRISFLDSGINLKARYLVDAVEWAETKSRIVENILEKFDREEDVEIAYPHMEIIYQSKDELANKLKSLSKNKN